MTRGYPQTAQKCLGGNFEGGAAAVRYEGPLVLLVLLV